MSYYITYICLKSAFISICIFCCIAISNVVFCRTISVIVKKLGINLGDLSPCVRQKCGIRIRIDNYSMTVMTYITRKSAAAHSYFILQPPRKQH